MQTSFHNDGLDFSRAPDVSGQSSDALRYFASGESLDALKARTTPKDITNPYISPHASCAHAFLATAVSLEHRYDEMHLDLPLSARALVDAEPSLFQSVTAISIEASPLPSMLNSQLIVQDMVGRESVDLSSMPAVSAPHQLFEPLDLSQLIATMPATELPQQETGESQFVQAETRATIIANSHIAVSGEYDDTNEVAVFSGSAPAETLLQFYIDEVLVGSTESDSEGRWQFEQPAGLPAAEYSFSVILRDDQGSLGRIEFPFVIKPLPEAFIMPIYEDDLAEIDIALIDLALERDEAPELLMPLVLTEEMFEGWQTMDGISTLNYLQPIDLVGLNDMENANIIWH
jgi:hypothetical protein